MPGVIRLKSSSGFGRRKSRTQPDNIHQDKELAAAFIAKHGLPVPEFEWKFHPHRRWRFDMAYPDKLIALEIEGGAWVSGRHCRGKGFIDDRKKYTAAALLGWRILYATPDTFASGAALEDVKQALGVKEA